MLPVVSEAVQKQRPGCRRNFAQKLTVGSRSHGYRALDATESAGQHLAHGVLAQSDTLGASRTPMESATAALRTRGRASTWAEFMAGEQVKQEGHSRKPQPATASLFEWVLGDEQERGEEPVGAGC